MKCAANCGLPGKIKVKGKSYCLAHGHDMKCYGYIRPHARPKPKDPGMPARYRMSEHLKRRHTR